MSLSTTIHRVKYVRIANDGYGETFWTTFEFIGEDDSVLYEITTFSIHSGNWVGVADDREND